MKAKTFLIKLAKCTEEAVKNVQNPKEKIRVSAKFKSLRSDELEKAVQKHGPRIPYASLQKIYGKSEGNLVEIIAEKSGKIILRFWNHNATKPDPRRLKRALVSAKKIIQFVEENPQFSEFEVFCMLDGGCSDQLRSEFEECEVVDVILGDDGISAEVKLKTEVV